jgi:hypothetical protein
MYVLSATDIEFTEYTRIDADNDLDATMQAIAVVLDRAHADKDGLWAIGEINLLSPDGLIIQHMPMKRDLTCPDCGDVMNDNWTDLGCEGDSNA